MSDLLEKRLIRNRGGRSFQDIKNFLKMKNKSVRDCLQSKICMFLIVVVTTFIGFKSDTDTNGDWLFFSGVWWFMDCLGGSLCWGLEKDEGDDGFINSKD